MAKKVVSDEIKDWNKTVDDTKKRKDKITDKKDFDETYFKELYRLEKDEAEKHLRARFFGSRMGGNSIANPPGAAFGNPAGGERATSNTVVNCSLVYVDAAGVTKTQDLGPASPFGDGIGINFYWMKSFSYPLPSWQYIFLADFVDGGSTSRLQKSAISPP